MSTPDPTTPGGRIIVDTDGQVTIITISCPEKRNALSFDMWGQLRDAAASAGANPSQRVLVVRGAGEAAFSAGADITEFTAIRDTAERAERYSGLVESTERALIDSPKPTIALLHGICAGGGGGLALACALRFADDTFRFSIPAAKLGVVYHQTAVDRLVQHVGPSAALDILMSARSVDSAEALRRGLVDAVHPPAELVDRVLSYAHVLARHAPLSLRGAHLGVRAAVHPYDPKIREEVAALQTAAIESPDYHEGVRAFMEKRQPDFRGG